MANFSVHRIGRDPDVDIRIDDTSVSRLHAELIVTASGLYHLTDCGSLNGTYLARDGAWEPVRQVYITPDDLIRLGPHQVGASQLISRVTRDGGGGGQKSRGQAKKTDQDDRPCNKQKYRRDSDGRIIAADD